VHQAACAEVDTEDEPPSDVEQVRERVAELETQLQSVYIDRLDLLAVLAVDPTLHARLAADVVGLPGLRTVLYLTDDTVGQMSSTSPTRTASGSSTCRRPTPAARTRRGTAATRTPCVHGSGNWPGAALLTPK
jgi:hypothetical protein